MLRLEIVGRSIRARAALSEAFRGCDRVHVVEGDILAVPNVEAVISPANSFGRMDGGVDQVFVYEFGQQIEDRVKQRIQRDHGGELKVGEAFVISTLSPRVPYLVVAPTMRIPGPIRGTQNIYLALRAALYAVRAFNAAEGSAIRAIASPMLGTGTGAVPVMEAATQMRRAWDLCEGGG